MRNQQIEKSYRPDEVAALLGFCRETIRRWARLGLIAHFHSPKGLRIPQAEIDRIRRDGVVKSSQK
jgi:predicted site-specific integrase-resolvase